MTALFEELEMSEPEREIRGELIIMCGVCAEDFIVSEGERITLYGRKEPLPKKCPSCRKEDDDHELQGTV